MKISDKVKLILGFTFFTLLYLFCIYLGLKKQNIDLNKTNKIIIIVENRGIDIRYGSKGKKDDVFYIKLENYDKKLGVYRMSKNYEDLIKKINIGDEVKIYFYENSNLTENVNIDLIQVEKKDTILIDKSEFEGKERFLIYAGIGGIIVNIIILVYNRKKYFKPKKSVS